MSTTTEPMTRAEIIDLVARGKRSRTRGQFFTALFGALLTFAINTALNGWLLMALADTVRTYWFHALPTVGYWGCVVTAMFARLLVANGSSVKKATS